MTEEFHLLTARPAAGMVRMRVLRPFFIDSTTNTTVGQVVDIDALAAADVLQARRGELVDAGQRADVFKAIDADNAGHWRAGKPSRFSGRA